MQMIKQMPPHIAALPAELRRLNGILPPMPPPSGIIDALAKWHDQHADILACHADRKVSRHLDDWLALTLFLAAQAEREGLDPAPLVQMHADGQSLALGRFAPAPPPLTQDIYKLLTHLRMRAKHAEPLAPHDAQQRDAQPVAAAPQAEPVKRAKVKRETLSQAETNRRVAAYLKTCPNGIATLDEIMAACNTSQGATAKSPPYRDMLSRKKIKGPRAISYEEHHIDVPDTSSNPAQHAEQKEFETLETRMFAAGKRGDREEVLKCLKMMSDEDTLKYKTSEQWQSDINAVIAQQKDRSKNPA